MRKKLDITIAGHDVVFSRRKGTRHLRISIKSDSTILLTAPHIVSEKKAVEYLLSKKDWIEQHIKPTAKFEDNSLIGKGGRVIILTENIEAPSVRVHKYDVIVKVASLDQVQEPELQKKIATSADKSIKKQAEVLLPQRLEQLSKKYGISYRSSSVRKLKSRWGSCDSNNDITLNMYLIQLDWSLIDYVIVHELVHTIHKHHQSEFWDEVTKILPEHKELRKRLKEHKTTAFAQ